MAKHRKRIAPPAFLTYGEHGGDKNKNPQKTSAPPPHGANDMRKWSQENQK